MEKEKVFFPTSIATEVFRRDDGGAVQKRCHRLFNRERMRFIFASQRALSFVRKMNKQNFDELLERFIKQCREEATQENSMTLSTVVLEIDGTIRSIDRQLEHCKYLINDNLKRYESQIVLNDRVSRSRRDIAIFDNEMRHFGTSIVSRMSEIAKIREDFLTRISEKERESQRCNENLWKIQRLKREMILQGNTIADEISSVEKNIKILEARNQDAVVRLNFLNVENDNYRDSLEKEVKLLQRRVQENRDKLNRLDNCGKTDDENFSRD